MTKRTAVTLTFLALLASAAHVSEAQWRHVGGPEGGRVTGLAVSGKKIYASAGSRALFLSEDNGTSWRAGSFYLPFGRLRAANSKALFAGDSKYGLNRSADGGNRWEPFGFPCPRSYPPRSIGPIATSGTGIFAACHNEIHYTTDDGRTWAPIAPGWPSNHDITALAADGGTVGVIAQAPLLKNQPDWSGAALYLSLDRGKTWKQISIGGTDGLLSASLAIDGRTLYASSHKSGLVMTEDEGATWRKAGTGLPDDLSFDSLAVEGSCLFAGTRRGIFRSTDRGKNWSAVNTGLTSVAIEFLVERTGTLVAGTERGIFLSGDEGLSWSAALPGLPEDVELAGLVNAGPVLYASAYEDGIFASSDGGRTWISATPDLLKKTSVNCLEHNGDDLIAGTKDGVFRFAKNGAFRGWRNEGLTDPDIDCIASSAGRLVAKAGWRGVFVSEDAGVHWRAVEAGLPEAAFFTGLVVSEGAFYGGTVEGVFALNDDGFGWTARSGGLPGSAYITCLAAKGNMIAAGTDDGVFITRDKGARWKSAGTGLPGSVAILSLLFKGNDLFAGTETGVWRLPLPDGWAKAIK